MQAKIPPLLIVFVLGAGMLAADARLPGHFDFPGRAWAAYALVAAGILLVLLGVGRFRKADTTVDPLHPDRASELVTGGVYRFTRNPMYLGFAAVLAGWDLYLGSWFGALSRPLYVLLMNRFQIGPEERALAGRFGAAYQAYRSRVRRWL